MKIIQCFQKFSGRCHTQNHRTNYLVFNDGFLFHETIFYVSPIAYIVSFTILVTRIEMRLYNGPQNLDQI